MSSTPLAPMMTDNPLTAAPMPLPPCMDHLMLSTYSIPSLSVPSVAPLPRAIATMTEGLVAKHDNLLTSLAQLKKLSTSLLDRTTAILRAVDTIPDLWQTAYPSSTPVPKHLYNVVLDANFPMPPLLPHFVPRKLLHLTTT